MKGVTGRNSGDSESGRLRQMTEGESEEEEVWGEGGGGRP